MERYFRKMKVWKFIVILLAGFLIGPLVLDILFMDRLKKGGIFNPLSPDNAFLTFFLSVGVYGALLILMYVFGLESEDRKGIFVKAPSRSRGNILFVLAPMAIGGLFNIIYALILDKTFPEFAKKMMEQGNISSNLKGLDNPVSIAMMFFSIVIAAPVVEEILFRGVLFNFLNKKTSLFLAALISSAAFGILHGATFVQTTLMGFILALLYQLTGSIWVAILGHAANNAFALLEATLITNKIVTEGTSSEMIFGGTYLVVSVAVLIAAIIYLTKNPLPSIFRDVAPIYKTDVEELLESEVQ